jgi:hypothetical protein
MLYSFMVIPKHIELPYELGSHFLVIIIIGR